MTTGTILIALTLMTIVAYLGLEAWAGLTGRPLITTKVREWNRKTGGFVALVFGLVAGGLGAHFFWCQGW